MSGASPHSIISAYRFIFACGTLKAGFQKIGGLGGRIEVEYIREGGQNEFAYPVRGVNSTTGKLTFEKGHGLFNPFYGPSGFAPGAYITAPCSIVVYGDDKAIRRVYAFDHALIISWDSTTLDAGTGELLIDKVEIEHTGLYEVAPTSARVAHLKNI